MWRWGRILLLIFGVAALALYYIYVDFHGKEDQAIRMDSKRILTLPEGSEITGLKITNRDGETVELKKEDANWWLLNPVRYPAEAFVVDGLIAALAKTTWDRRFTSGSIDLGEAGLREPMQRVGISFKNADGVKDRYLLLGEGTKTSHKVYAMWGDEAYVFMVHEQFARAMDKSAFSMRKKKIFDLGLNEVQSFQMVLDGEDLTLMSENGKWFRVWRDSREVPKEKVETLWDNLTTLYSKAFLDELNPDNPDLGFYSPKSFITVTLKSGGAQTLWVGNENKEKEGFYGLKDGEKSVLLMNDVLFRQIIEGFKGFGAAAAADPEPLQPGVIKLMDGMSKPKEVPEEPEGESSGVQPEEEVLIEPVSQEEEAQELSGAMPLQPVDLKEIGRMAPPPVVKVSPEREKKEETGTQKPKTAAAEIIEPREEKTPGSVVEMMPKEKPVLKPESKTVPKEETAAIAPKIEPAVEIAKETKSAPLSSGDWISRVRSLSLKKLGTEVKLLKEEGQWRFETGGVLNPGKLDSSVGDLLNCLGTVRMETRVEDSRKPRVPYAITANLELSGTETRQFVFYKTRGEILAESSSKEGLYSVAAEVWSDLERDLGNILTCKNFKA